MNPTAMRAYSKKAGCIARPQICKTDSKGRSSGACRTMASEPVMHSTHPTNPNTLRRSFNKWCARMALTRMLRAPRGVTRTAGAKA